MQEETGFLYEIRTSKQGRVGGQLFISIGLMA
jgi:hypothetical protein